MSIFGEVRKRITDIAHDAIHDDAFQGPRRFYAWDACEDTSFFSGPCASVAEALEEFLDEHDVDDEWHVEVTLAAPAGMPRVCCVAERLSERAYENYGERGGEAIDLAPAEEDALDDAVNAAIAAFFAARGGNPLEGFWLPYGRTLETTAGNARRWLAEIGARA